MKERPPLKERNKEASRPHNLKSYPQKSIEDGQDSQSKTKLYTIFAGVGLVLASLAVSFSSQIFNKLNTDSISDSEIKAINSSFNAAVANGATIFLPVDFSDSKERQKAKSASGLPETEAEHLLKEAEGGFISLAWVTVWDNLAEDGDVIEVSAGGMTHVVPIMHEPTTIVVPYSMGNAQLMIKGLKDGGGGITVSAKTGSGDLALPPMRVGEVKNLRFN